MVPIIYIIFFSPITGFTSKVHQNLSSFSDRIRHASHSSQEPVMTPEGELSLPPVGRPYSPPTIVTNQGEPATMMQNDATYKSHDQGLQSSERVLESHAISGDLSSGYVGTNSSIDDQAQIQNETQNRYQNLELNQDRPMQNVSSLAASANSTSSSKHDHTHLSHSSCPLSHQSASHVQGGGPFIQQQHPDQLQTSTERPENTNQETDQSHASKLEDKATPINQVEPVPVTTALKRPAAINALKRHTYETYSSDDDDVFLPNPPSKSQADKCIVAMVTEDEVGRENTTITVTAATPEKEEKKLSLEERDKDKVSLGETDTGSRGRCMLKPLKLDA